MKPMISIAAMAGLMEAITAAGKNPDQILHALGLDRSVFENPDGFVASFIFAQLLEEAGRQTVDDCFGLHFGERFNPKNIGPLVTWTPQGVQFAHGSEKTSRPFAPCSVSFFLLIEQIMCYLRHSTDSPANQHRSTTFFM